MSAIGTKRTYGSAPHMSAIGGKADISNPLHGLHFIRNALISNGSKTCQFVDKMLRSKQKDVTLNQRVPGSSPGAPTNILYSLTLIWRIF